MQQPSKPAFSADDRPARTRQQPIGRPQAGSIGQERGNRAAFHQSYPNGNAAGLTSPYSSPPEHGPLSLSPPTSFHQPTFAQTMPAVIGPARMSASSSNRTRVSPDPHKEKLPAAFLKQAAQNTDNIRRLLQDFKQDSDEDEDEEVDIPHAKHTVIADTTFAAYRQLALSNSSEDLTDPALTKTKELMQRASDDCLICYARVKSEQAVWECVQCYTIFHLSCIQSYVRKRVLPMNAAAARELFPSRADPPWLCPKCRHCYDAREAPTRYYCFCRKTEDPIFDIWRAPHTCGQICNKQLRPACGHQCVLLCHPGPCPSCPQTVRAECFCGKATSLRRCATRFFSCGKLCGKLLRCGLHRCSLSCHDGNCEPCKQQGLQACRCGRSKSMRSCQDTDWSCGQVCNNPYACALHECKKVCHKGDCGPCPLSLPRSCFCGKKVLTLACDEPTTSCGDTCGKLLACGYHSCIDRCHKGPCSPCVYVRKMTCRCGGQTKEHPCSKEFLCERRCTQSRNCQRHQCKRKCCPGPPQCPPCKETCGQKLACKVHTCEATCHPGPCLPCPLEDALECACGASRMVVPCGLGRSAQPPACDRACPTPSFCHHPRRFEHRCHYGFCPPCDQICNVPHADCGHPCLLACHDPQLLIELPKDMVKKKKPINLQKVDLLSQLPKSFPPCPPCCVVVTRQCLGKHEERKVVCSTPRDLRCGRPCGNLLECGNHACQLPCHRITRRGSTFDNEEKHDSCKKCELPCLRPRVPPCKHPCTRPCHSDPCAPCTKMLKRICHCPSGVIKYIPCNESHDAEHLAALLSCGQVCRRRLAFCAHTCTKVCHAGECLDAVQCKRKVTATCPCKRRKEEWICKDVQEVKRSHPARFGSKRPEDLVEVLAVLVCDAECEALRAQRLASAAIEPASPRSSHTHTAPSSSSSSSTTVHHRSTAKSRATSEASSSTKSSHAPHAPARRSFGNPFLILLSLSAAILFVCFLLFFLVLKK